MHDRDTLLARTDLPVLASELLGPPRNRKWPCPNPDHPQTGRTPPVSIFATREGHARWRCHGCGAGGTAIDLIMVARRTDVRSAIETLADHTNTNTTPAPLPRVPTVDRSAADVEAFIAECAERLWRPAGAAVRRWAMGHRGLSEETLRTNQIGADAGHPSRDRPAAVPAAGPALVLPTHQHDPRRSVQLRLLRPRLTGAKYLNPRGPAPSGARVAIFQAGPAHNGTTVITEGAIDALSVTTLGINAVAVLGVAAADRHAAALIAERPGRLVLAFDADDAGRAAQHRLAALLADLGRPTTQITPPPGINDINEWLIDATTRRTRPHLKAVASAGIPSTARDGLER